jgi:hypothetical protein
MWRTPHPALLAAALPALLIAFLATGCASTRAHLPREEAQVAAKVSALKRDLLALAAGTDASEARRVAETAVVHSLNLAQEYRVTAPALWHNVLIQMGLRDRGLCYHWTEDLMRRLQRLDLASFRLHWGVAHRGSDLREHNSVVISAATQPFERGIVLDPWRNSGDLFWTAVAGDSYPWEILPPEEW